MLKAVIFDMDGVIIDSEPFYLKAERKLFDELGLDISREEHNCYIGTKMEYMWTNLKAKYGLEQPIDELVQAEKDTYKSLIMLEKDLKPIAGVSELIKELFNNGIKTAIASSSSVEAIDDVVTMFNIKKFFTILVSGDQVKNSKPAPDIFIYAAGLLGVLPKECIVIEDSKNGVAAAKAAGMKCVAFRNPNSGNQDLSMADIVVDSLLELDLNKLRKL